VAKQERIRMERTTDECYTHEHAQAHRPSERQIDRRAAASLCTACLCTACLCPACRLAGVVTYRSYARVCVVSRTRCLVTIASLCTRWNCVGRHRVIGACSLRSSRRGDVVESGDWDMNIDRRVGARTAVHVQNQQPHRQSQQREDDRRRQSG
jgi:hypothetical protein